MMRERMQRRRKRHQDVADLDITAFMNLMVILVPFLLITAVFSRVAVVDLFLPVDGQSDNTAKPVFSLQLVLRDDVIVVSEKRTRLLKRFKINNGDYDRKALARVVYQVKRRFPAQRQATLLAAGDINYDLLVSVMDLVRVQVNASDVVELFPDISIGDAPVKRVQG